MPLPEPVDRRLQQWAHKKFAPAWLRVDNDGRLVESGGSLRPFGLDALAAGARVERTIVALGGLLAPPVETALEFVAMAPDIVADLHVQPTDGGAWILVIDASEVAAERRALQQRANETSVESDNLGRLLDTVMPRSVTGRLKAGERRIADDHGAVTLLYSNIAYFDYIAEQMAPADVATLLGRVFAAFDELARLHGLQKINTHGDTYFAGAGLPQPRPDHAVAAAEMALDMQEAVRGFEGPDGRPLQLCIGLHSGPVAAGVIGARRLGFDVWGATVTRVRSLAVAPRAIRATPATRALLPGRYRWRGKDLLAPD